jgi:MoxR-like ATPase
MGETGIGKTAIVSYLSDVLDRRFLTLNMHEGITEK